MNKPLPLLLLPGLMNDQRVWETLQDVMSSDRVVVVGKTHIADNIAAIASSVLKLMPPGPFAIAGFSLGGYVTLEVCRQATDRIAGIALIDTGPRADTEESQQNRQRMIDSLAAGSASYAQVAGAFASRLLHPDHAKDPALQELLGDMAVNVGAEGFVKQQTAAKTRPDARGILPKLKCPALVLCGREDQVTPLPLSEEMAGLLAGDVDLVVVPDSGHMSTLEQPMAVAKAFARWLKRVDAAKR